MAGEPVVGDPSGHGRYGILDTNEYGVLCHECGERFASVGIHSQRVHDLTSREYRERHGVEGRLALPRGEGTRRRPRACPRCGRTVTTRRRTCDQCWAVKQERRTELPAVRGGAS